MKLIAILFFLIPTYAVAQTETPVTSPLGVSPTRAEVNAYLAANPDIDTVEEFITKALHPVYRERFVLMFKSAAFTGFLTDDQHPRVISFGADARATFAWATHEAEFRKNIVEIMVQEDDQWFFGDIDMDSENPQIVPSDSCATCHGGGKSAKPLWGSYPDWSGSEEPNVFASNIRERKLLKELETSTHPRLEPLVIEQRGPFKRVVETVVDDEGTIASGKPAAEFQAMLQARHSDVLFRRIKQRTDYEQFREQVLCSSLSRDELGKEFPNFMAIHRFAFGVDFPLARPNRPDYNGGNGSVAFGATILLVNDLYDNNLAVKTHLDGLDNGTISFRGVLPFYPPGTGKTVADEMKAYVARYNTLGKEPLRLRLLHPSGENKALGAASLAMGLASQACAALRPITEMEEPVAET